MVKIRDILMTADDSAPEQAVAMTTLPSEMQFTQFHSLSSQQVEKLIRKSPDKSCELDPLPTWLVKLCLPELSALITSIVNSSLESASVSTSLKAALVRPLMKKPTLDQNILKNFRPVSNLPFVSKVIEKAVAEQLKNHLKANGMYDAVQSAYREYHSTETALLKVHNDILLALDQDQVVVLVMLDLSAAFDTIDHEILLTRLKERYGVTGQALAWIESYLEYRSWAVIIDGHRSQQKDLQYGVPQGSILGPLLFVLYIAPVSDIVCERAITNHGYADDSQLYCAFHHIERQQSLQSLELCVMDIKSWMKRNWLKLNDDKTEVMVFGTRRSIARRKISSSRSMVCSISSKSRVRCFVAPVFEKRLMVIGTIHF
jgi:hypothetical protein